MLQIVVPAREYWDEENETFVNTKAQVLQLEHSLISVSKWESKWNKAFLSGKDKTVEEWVDYVRCMTINKNVDPSVYQRLTEDNFDEIRKYVSAKMTATYIHHPKSSKQQGGDTVTSELIYYWMIVFGIPFECEKWHLNRLMALIDVCRVKSGYGNKMTKAELASRNRALNEARKAKLHTHG